MVEQIHLVVTGEVPEKIRAYVDERMAHAVIHDARDFDCEDKMTVVPVDLERYSAYDRKNIPWNPPSASTPMKNASKHINKDKDMTNEIITADQFRAVCRKLGLELKESTDHRTPGMLGISAYVYSPIFKFGKDSIAEFFVQDEYDTPLVQYCTNVETDDNYGNFLVIDEGLTGLWPSAKNVDDLELQLRRAIDNIKKIEDETTWPKRQKITIEIYYDQHKDNRFTREDLDEVVWKLFDNLSEKTTITGLSAASMTYFPKGA